MPSMLRMDDSDEERSAPPVISLRELQRRFAEALVVPSPADGRLAIYARSVRANYRRALAATYPVVEAVLGTGVFGALVDAYVQAHPSTSGDLNLYGGELGDFLASHAHAASPPYLADLARLEWNIDEASRARDVEGSAEDVLAALAAVPAELLGDQRLAVNPSCRILASDFPVLHIWRMHQPGCVHGDPGAAQHPGGHWVLRRTVEGVRIDAVDPAVFEWLAVLSRGGTLDQSITAAVSVDEGFDLTAALRTAISNRIVVGVKDAGDVSPGESALNLC